MPQSDWSCFEPIIDSHPAPNSSALRTWFGTSVAEQQWRWGVAKRAVQCSATSSRPPQLHRQLLLTCCMIERQGQRHRHLCSCPLTEIWRQPPQLPLACMLPDHGCHYKRMMSSFCDISEVGLRCKCWVEYLSHLACHTYMSHLACRCAYDTHPAVNSAAHVVQ